MDNLKLTAGRYSPCAECDKKPCSSCMYQYLFNEYQAKIDEHKKVSTNRKKLVVHESDYNGQGYFGILGNSKSFYLILTKMKIREIYIWQWRI